MGERCRLLLLSTLSLLLLFRLLLCLPMCYGKCSISTDETPRTRGERGVTEQSYSQSHEVDNSDDEKFYPVPPPRLFPPSCSAPSRQPFAHMPLAYPALTYANCIGGFGLRFRFGFCMQIIGRGLCSMLQFEVTGRGSDWASEAEDWLDGADIVSWSLERLGIRLSIIDVSRL